MNKVKQLTLVLSITLLTVVNAHALLQNVGNAVGNVLSTTGRATTGALDVAKNTVGRVTGVRTESGLVRGPRGYGLGYQRLLAQDSTDMPSQEEKDVYIVAPRSNLSGVATPSYLSEDEDDIEEEIYNEL